MLEKFGALLTSLQGAPAGVHRRVWEELSPWFGRLASQAAIKWLPRLAANIRCSVMQRERGTPTSQCHARAVATCMVCRRPICINHSFVDHYGEAICYDCVVRAANEQRGPNANKEADSKKPTEAKVAWARRVLRVKDTTPLEDIKKKYRKLCYDHHPDRQRDPAKKPQAEQRFKDIQEAWVILQEVAKSE